MNESGQRRLKRKTIQLKARWAEALENSVLDSAVACAGIARQNAPVGPGGREPHLRDSFSTSVRKAEGAVEAYCTVRNPHAGYVEFGTGRRGAASGAGQGYDPDWPGMAARPYMRPAAEACRGAFSAGAAKAMLDATGGAG